MVDKEMKMRLVLNHSEACEMIEVGGDFTFALADKLIQIYEEAEAYVGFDFFLVDEPNDCVWIFEDEWVKYLEDL
jgi:hypothetical protein